MSLGSDRLQARGQSNTLVRKGNESGLIFITRWQASGNVGQNEDQRKNNEPFRRDNRQTSFVLSMLVCLSMTNKEGPFDHSRLIKLGWIEILPAQLIPGTKAEDSVNQIAKRTLPLFVPLSVEFRFLAQWKLWKVILVSCQTTRCHIWKKLSKHIKHFKVVVLCSPCPVVQSNVLALHRKSCICSTTTYAKWALVL